jgi:hypothetical protein
MAGPVRTNEIKDVVSSVRRIVSIEVVDQPGSRDRGTDRLLLSLAQRVAPEGATAAVPLILTTRVRDESVHGLSTEPMQVVEAEWEEEIWSEPEPPLAELALGAEEAELATESVPVEPEPAPSNTDDASAAAYGKTDGTPWGEVGDDWLDEDLQLLAPGQTPPVLEQPDETEGKRSDVLKLSAEQILTDGDGNPLTILDEAALQQIIRQLIRDELKGVLGERITHSVRKLVRAEIKRALAAQALD